MRLALPFLALLTSSAAQAALSPAELAGVGSTPPAGARLPLLPFVDQNGARTILSPDGPPTVLLFADYSCRHICGPGITLTAGALHDAGKRPGRDYRMVVIGMDQDGPALARKVAGERLQGLPDEARAMRLLTGTPATVATAEQALGYHAAYDREADQFAHDSAIYVFDRTGRLSALLPETATRPEQIAEALRGAERGVLFAPAPRNTTAGLGDRISAICYGLASAHGVYSGPIVLALRLGGVAVCLVAAGLFLWGRLRRRRAA